LKKCRGQSWSLASKHCQLRAAVEVLVPYTSERLGAVVEQRELKEARAVDSR
jgi:hypothetical protein